MKWQTLTLHDFSHAALNSGLFFAVDELFPGRWRQYEQRPDSFAEQQAKFARIGGEAALDRGEHLLECLQSKSLSVFVKMGRG